MLKPALSFSSSSTLRPPWRSFTRPPAPRRAVRRRQKSQLISAPLGEIVRSASDQIACNEKKGRVYNDLGCGWHGANTRHSRRPQHSSAALSPSPFLSWSFSFSCFVLPSFLLFPPYQSHLRHFPFPPPLLPSLFECFAAPFLIYVFFAFHYLLFFSLSSFSFCCGSVCVWGGYQTLTSYPFSVSVFFRVFIPCVFPSLLFPLLFLLRWTFRYLFVFLTPSLRHSLPASCSALVFLQGSCPLVFGIRLQFG